MSSLAFALVTGARPVIPRARAVAFGSKLPAMTTIDATPSSNGVGRPAWSGSWEHVVIDRPSTGCCRVTFDHPPINTITPTMVAELAELIELIEADADLNVVVFDSSNPGFYLSDLEGEHDRAAWLVCLARLSRSAVVSIASIRGRACGAGSEFVLACDLRFASRENTLIGQLEVPTGVVRGGDPTANLARLVGRGRALEILLVADDVDGPRAERYGYVNRAIADDRLDAEVGAIASRLARVDREALARVKAYVGA